MNIQVIRKEFTHTSTLGDMYVDGNFECYTLEDAVHAVGVEGATAIPAGSYEIALSYSERLQRPLPLLIDVPDFRSVRIHPGSGGRRMEGSILVGKIKEPDFVGASKAAFEGLFDKIQTALTRSKIVIHITEQRAA